MQLILDQAHTVLTTAPGDRPPSLQGGAPEGLAARARTRDNRIRRPNPHGCRRHREGGARQGPVELDAALRGPGVATPLEHAFDHLAGHTTRLLRRAVQFVLRGIRKLSAVFGATVQGVRDRVNDWVTDLVGDPTEPAVDKWLRKLYRVDAIEQELAAKIKAAPDSTLSQMDRAAFEVDLSPVSFTDTCR